MTTNIGRSALTKSKHLANHTYYILEQQRLKEMRQLTKDPNAAAKARERANEESGLKSINLSLSSAAGAQPGKKKPVFKSTLQPHNAALLAGSSESKSSSGLDGAVATGGDDPSGAVANEWFEERYQPRFVSACDDPRCLICRGSTFVDLEKVVAGRKDVEMGGV